MLGLATSGGTALAGPSTHPFFYRGFLPSSAATGLVAVARVVRTRYFQAAERAYLDPVVTCSGDRLRFESFSGCCGVYARLDVLSAALDGEVIDRGTTNVDVNEPLRRALPRVVDGDPLHLSVGSDRVVVGTLDGIVEERKVRISRSDEVGPRRAGAGQAVGVGLTEHDPALAVTPPQLGVRDPAVVVAHDPDVLEPQCVQEPHADLGVGVMSKLVGTDPCRGLCTDGHPNVLIVVPRHGPCPERT